jgi:ABC-type multidrug transport system fused ATPase/permease subunit
MDMNSVERIEEYSAVVPEKYVGDEERRAAMQQAGGSGGGGDAAVLALEKKAMIDASRVLSFAELWQTVRAGHANDTTTAASFQQSQAKLSHATTNPMAPSSSSSLSGSNWPTAGKLEFKGLSMRYKSQADRPVLNGVSFAVAPREKIGVVGRTGAGKSSLIIALYRLVEPFAGQICIDDVNILSMPLYAIRSNIAIVPQEPTLFKGTLRFNLDPFREYCDEDIYEALQRVQLCDNLGLSAAYTLCRQRGRGYGGQGYDAESALETFLVAEKGGNFSVGQRQLLCMARAILRKTKVLVLDECTASVDHETDALIQDIVRTQLASTTVLCIAHRLHTVAYYDKVLVMDKGEAREFDTPLSLMHQEHSIFRSLCISSGSFDQLVAIATEATVRKQQLATM